MDDLAGAAALVTGGAGFIGSHLVDRLLARGCSPLVVVDTFFLGKRANLVEASAAYPNQLKVYREDAADQTAMAELCRRHRPDIVFNLATKPLLYSFFNPPGACRVNLEIALTLGELHRSGAFTRLVHVSSSEVYGTALEVPMGEDHPLGAQTTYAAGKAAADLALASYCSMFGLDIVTVRPFNNYGPRQNSDELGAVVPKTIRRILLGEKPVVEGDGRQTRDFMFVADTVAAILRLAEADDVTGALFNLGSGRETSILDIVRGICHAMDYDGPLEWRPLRSADVRRHVADVDRAVAKLGGVAPTPLAAGLSQTVNWYSENTS